MSRYTDHYPIYCDGSVNGGKSGCGVWGRDFSIKSRLPDNSSILTCELYAIYCSISYISNFDTPALILTDSLSAVEALKSAHTSKHHLILTIANAITRLPPNQITIQWIPSHVGIPGNDKADMLAKKSHELNYITQVPFSTLDATRLATQRIKEKISPVCSPCNHNTSISLLTTSKPPNFLLTPRHIQTVLARLHLRVTNLTHLHLITKTPPKTCERCNIVTSLHHIFMICPHLHDHRQVIIDYCSSQNILFSLDSILNGAFPPNYL